MVMLDGYKVSRTQQLEDLTTGLGTSLSALAQQVWTESPMSSAFRQNKLEQATFGGFKPGTKGAEFLGPKSPVLTKQDADKRISEAGVKLKVGDRGIPEEALSILIERKREEVKHKALINAAPEGFWSGAAQIGTGLAVSIADPINVASAFIPIVGQARYAKLIADASTTLGRTGVRAGVGAVSGFVGAAIVEPIVLLAAESEQADYGLYNSFLNLTFGAVLGGGLHVGLGAVGDAIARSKAQTKEDLLRAAIGRAMDDQPVDVAFVAKVDKSFREEWRNGEVEAVIRGADADTRVKAEFNRVMDELRPELIVKAQALPDDVSAKAIADLEAGRVPESFINDVAKIVKSRIEDFEAPAPKIDAKSSEASDLAARQADETISQSTEATPESVDVLTSDILKALDEQEVNTTTLRTEIDEINKTAERDAKGLREAVMCALGK